MLEKKKETYLFNYEYNGKTKGFRVEAESWDEARAIAKAMGAAECIGILRAEIHLKSKSLTARIVTKLAKFFGKEPNRKEF